MIEELKPFISKTSNVSEFIKKVSRKFQIPPSKIDFDILNVFTGVKLPNKDGYVTLTPKLEEKINTDIAFLKSSKIDIRQSYELNIRPKFVNDPIELVLEIAIDKFHSKATGILKKSSRFDNKNALVDIITDEINKRKVKLGIIINLREDGMREKIKTIVSIVKERGRLVEDINIPITKWIAPIPTIHDRLIFHYNEAMSQDENSKKIDYADRGFVKEVNKDDLIVEYNHPIPGASGRAFNGRHLPAKKPLLLFRDALIPDKKTVRVESSDGDYFYYAKKDGFVSVENKILRVGENMAITSINFKETGHVVTDLDKNITITTTGKEGEDDIGINMKVETTNIDIGGDVGAGAEVKAVNVVVNGSTHGTSKIICSNAKIKNLKGSLECKTAVISTNEGGHIIADKAKVGLMKGGKVHCAQININTLGSNVVIFAKNSVKIHKTEKGGENIIVLDPGATKEDKRKIRLALNELNELRAKKKLYFSKYRGMDGVVKKNKPGIDVIREKIAKNKEKGLSTEKMFMDKYKAHQRDIKKLKKLKDALESVNFSVEQKAKHVNELQGVVLRSYVKNDDLWRGFNKITFKTLVPPREFSFSPEEDSYAKEIRLRQKNPDDIEDGFEVYVVGEDEEKYEKKEGKEVLSGKEFKK